jgi:hypothetical protein
MKLGDKLVSSSLALAKCVDGPLEVVGLALGSRGARTRLVSRRA